jgi:hypothetical protein
LREYTKSSKGWAQQRGHFVAHAIVRVKQKRGNRIRRLPLWVERLRENYLVFFSIVSVFFSSIFSVDFSLAFLVRLVLAFAPFDFVLPVSSLVELDFSVAVSFFFSVAGGVAGLGEAGRAEHERHCYQNKSSDCVFHRITSFRMVRRRFVAGIQIT